MKNKFKSLSLILALLLTLSSMLTACNTTPTPTPDIATSEEITTVVTEEISSEIISDESTDTQQAEIESQSELKSENELESDVTTEHTHIWVYDAYGDIGHFTSSECGCPFPEGSVPHYDENSDNLCDACKYQLSASESTTVETTVTESEAESGTENVTEAETTTEAESEAKTEASSEFNIKDIPAYSGEGYYVINGNKPYFTKDEITESAYESYGALDSLGRCTTAMACLGQELMPTGDRGSISSVKPTGWIQKQYSCIKTQDLYNRSHLIAWSLAGEDANKQNLITGTPYLNQQNMTLFEDMVRDYIKETGNHVMYRVTPIFEGNNLVASGVLMEAYSVEDNGYGIEFCVYLYNVQPGVVIDYATGDSHEEGKSPDDNTGDSDNVIEGVDGVPEGTTFIINTSSKKYHKLDSKYVGNLTKNMQYTTLSEAELIAQGYSLCGNCAKGSC